MIFPSEEVHNLRLHLEDRIATGELTEVAAYREAIEADPTDPRALRSLALDAEDDEDYPAAEDLAWRWLRADPLSHEAFLLIGRLLSRDPARAARGVAYRLLGREKQQYSAEAESDGIELAPPLGDYEPEEVTHEMEPHRLLHTLWVATTEAVDRSLIERILRRGADMRPLLVGILNLYAEDLLDEVDDAIVVRSLALLGEIGEPEEISALLEFFGLDDDLIDHASNWALARFGLRRPEAVLEQYKRLIPVAEPIVLMAIVQQIGVLPVIEGRADALLAVERRLPGLGREDAGSLQGGLIVSALLLEGSGGQLTNAFYARYGNSLPAQVRREFNETREAMRAHGPYIAEKDAVTVFDICCSEFDAAEEEYDDLDPFVRHAPKIGRNDPCWCGSGKKYKKCHLEADQNP